MNAGVRERTNGRHNGCAESTRCPAHGPVVFSPASLPARLAWLDGRQRARAEPKSATNRCDVRLGKGKAAAPHFARPPSVPGEEIASSLRSSQRHERALYVIASATKQSQAYETEMRNRWNRKVVMTGAGRSERDERTIRV